jgi:hypothetical protein
MARGLHQAQRATVMLGEARHHDLFATDEFKSGVTLFRPACGVP